MKKIMSICMFLVGFALITFSQQISFTFTANHACEYAPLNSVLIENITQGGDTTLQWNDTVLTISLTNVDFINVERNEFSVFQNYPNPFTAETNINVFVPDREKYTISVFDLTGREIVSYENILDRGLHNFTYFAGESKNYVLAVKSEKHYQNLLMIQMGSSKNTASELVYNGLSENKTDKDLNSWELRGKKSQFLYEIGDQLKFTGYVNGDYAEITETPSESTTYTFDINNVVPNAPVSSPPSVTESQITWSWSSVDGATGYKYNTTNNYNTATNVGTNTSYTQGSLTCDTEYNLHVWAYNACGESSVLILTEETVDPNSSFECGDTYTDCRDGNVYTTVQIGTQCWFAENLKTTQFRNGETITNVTGNAAWSGLSTPAWCHYENNSGYDASYGKLYNWFAVEDARGLCPEGWHVPTDAEWTTLTTHQGGVSVAGGKLKETGFTHWNSPNEGASNSSGFTARGGAARYDNGTWTNNHPSISSFIKYGGGWWTSTQFGFGAYWRGMAFNIESVARDTYDKKFGYSVRCLKD